MGTPTTTLEQVHEYTLVTQFGGGAPCPTIPTLSQVDVDALTEGDDDPLFVTLQISEVGRVSKNGVIYDEDLVSTIEQSIREGGVQALMGHLPDSEISTAFPHSDNGTTPLAGFWVGVLRVGEILWGKAYVPPGNVRKYIRQLKATGGKLGVSFFGRAHVEEYDDGTRRLIDFELDTLDFAPHNRASLTLAGDFEVTSEIDKQDQEGDMPTEINSINDVPQSVREQIRQQVLQETQSTENAQRVQELEQQVSEQEQTIAEMREYGRIVTEISAFLPDDADLVAIVREMNDVQMRLVEILGKDVSLVTRIEELHSTVQEFEQERFNSAVAEQVAELTDWQVSGEINTNRLNMLRQNFQTQVLAQMGDDRDAKNVAEVAQSVWDNGFRVIAESVRDAMAGPSAFVNSKQQPSDFKEQMKSPDEQKSLKAKYGIN